jgi:hypothetical protein
VLALNNVSKSLTTLELVPDQQAAVKAMQDHRLVMESRDECPSAEADPMC